MRNIDDLITDIASIVTSCRPGELMTIKKVEENYRAIYGNMIPYYEYGYSSVEKLIENYPQHFNFSTADGSLIIRTNVRSNITELISKEKKPKPKSHQFLSAPNSLNCPFIKHRRKELKIEPELPIITQKNIVEIFKRESGPIDRDELIDIFESTFGYELKYLDYGFVNLEHLCRELDGRLFHCGRHNQLYRLNRFEKSIYDYLGDILRASTGFTVPAVQEHVSLLCHEHHRVADLVRAEGFVNFIDAIYEAAKKKILKYDYRLIYPWTERDSSSPPPLLLYPAGLNRVRFTCVKSPSDFFVEIESPTSVETIAMIDDRLQHLSVGMELLSMFQEHCLCAVEYDSRWYRARIIDFGSNRGNQEDLFFDQTPVFLTNQLSSHSETVRLRFLDHPIELDNGIEISLPTDRLRFLPMELESVAGFIHRGSLAYVRPFAGGLKWNREACDRFVELVTDPDCVYESFLVADEYHTVTIDIVAVTGDGERLSVFHELVRDNLAIADV